MPVPDTEGCFEVKRVKMNILLDPQYLGDISIGVSERERRCLLMFVKSTILYSSLMLQCIITFYIIFESESR